MQKLIPIRQRGARQAWAETPGWAKCVSAAFVVVVIFFAATVVGPWAVSDFDGDGIPNWLDPIFNVTKTPLKGEIYPYVEPYAPQDTTDVDGAGTYEFWDADANPELIEPALTWGTDTHTTKDYASGQTFWFVCKSETANALDHFAWKITLPYEEDLGTDIAEARDTKLWDIEWDGVNEYWTVHFYACQEAQPELKAKTELGEDVGTTAIDMSDNNYEYNVEIRISLSSGNYDGIVYFFDPDEEANGVMDSLWLCLTANVTAANMGWTISGPNGEEWEVTSAANDFYLNLDPYVSAMGIGADEYGMFVRDDDGSGDSVFSLYFTIESSDLDTSGAGALLLYVDMYECSNLEDAIAQTWDSDTVDNFSTDPTQETVTFQD